MTIEDNNWGFGWDLGDSDNLSSPAVEEVAAHVPGTGFANVVNSLSGLFSNVTNSLNGTQVAVNTKSDVGLSQQTMIFVGAGLLAVIYFFKK